MRAKDENKEAVIRDQAIEMIVKEGFHGLSMQKLAKAAGLSASTIYIYFRNKEDMLNKLFFYVDDIFTRESLRNFDPRMNFAEGLWLQWKNRYRHIVAHPMHFHFSEQFRNSPLIRHKDIRDERFKSAMKEFVYHAVQRGDIPDLPAEVFWAMAYGPFYTLIKFHIGQTGVSGKPFSLSDQKMKQAFNLVLRGLAG